MAQPCANACDATDELWPHNQMSTDRKAHHTAPLLEADSKLIQLKKFSPGKGTNWKSHFALCLSHAVQGEAKSPSRLLQGLILACCTALTDLCGFQTWNRTAKRQHWPECLWSLVQQTSWFCRTCRMVSRTAHVSLPELSANPAKHPLRLKLPLLGRWMFDRREFS